MARSMALILVGLVVGAGATLLFAGGEDPDLTAQVEEKARESRRLAAEVDDLRSSLAEARERIGDLDAENERAAGAVADLRSRLERAEAAAAAAVPVEPAEPGAVEPVAAAGKPTDEELMRGVMSFGSALQDVILGDGGSEAVEKLRDLLERAGPEGMRFLLDKFESSDLGMMQKTVLAHALAQSGDPTALKALEDTLKDPDRGLIDHRVAAHGLAFTDEESVVPTLRQTAREDPDSGARANAAFGLARRGDEEGMELYASATDTAFEKRDPAALQYLSGFALLGKKAVPVMRERLGTYTDPQARIVLIELLKEQKDVGSVPALRALAGSSETDPDVRKAAEDALKALAK